MDMTQSIAAKSDQQERWLPIPGYEGMYEASDLGRVRGLDRVTSYGRKWRGRMMTPTPMPRGYLVVTLWRDGTQRVALVHRLVLMAFSGMPEDGVEALHGDGDPANNALTNLRWGTHAENQQDQIAHGTHANASKDCCPSGHEYTEANTYVYPGRPHRACRECRRENLRRWRARNPERSREQIRKAQLKYQAKKKAA